MEVVDVPSEFQVETGTYAGYPGPWIEQVFHKFVLQHGLHAQRSYIPVYWTNYARTVEARRGAGRRLNEFLAESLRPDGSYFTVLQHCIKPPVYDGQWKVFETDSGAPVPIRVPKDTVIFSAGGIGGPEDIPIPLLNADASGHAESRIRFILASFMGRTDGACDRLGVRAVMNEVMTRLSERFGFGYYCGSGSVQQFYRVTNRSVFCLCPRGWGPTSFRLFESMALGAIPVYIWNGAQWLPYEDELDWSEFAVVIHSDELESLPDILLAHSKEQIMAKQTRIRELYRKWFVMPAVCEYICGRCLKLAGKWIDR